MEETTGVLCIKSLIIDNPFWFKNDHCGIVKILTIDNSIIPRL
ncbi:18942_t:CDS:2, partial [Gigaspora rosea]